MESQCARRCEEGFTSNMTACSAANGRPQVLCIDDDLLWTKILETHLNLHNIDVIRAFSGQEGFALALRDRPQAIITDHVMPEGNADSLLSQLRHHPSTRNIPIIVVTGCDLKRRYPGDDVTLLARFQNLGAAAVLTKPLNHAELLATLSKFFSSPENGAAGSATNADQRLSDQNRNESTLARRGETTDEDEEQSNPYRSEKNLLIVDDDPNMRTLFERQLSRAGFGVRAVSTAQDAVDTALDWQPDAITLDVRLPDFDGLEAAAKLRDRAETRDTPIVFISGKVDSSFRGTCRNLGRSYYIRKPCDVSLLVQLLNSIFAEDEALQEMELATAVMT